MMMVMGREVRFLVIEATRFAVPGGYRNAAIITLLLLLLHLKMMMVMMIVVLVVLVL